MDSLKLITLNVELHRHWDIILPFLKREDADVICLQECFDRDAQAIANELGCAYKHLPMTKMPYIVNGSSSSTPQGIALLSKLPLRHIESRYYYKPSKGINNYKHATPTEKRATVHQGIIFARVEKNGTSFTIGTTHFTWTPDGGVNESQETDAAALFKILESIPELVLCGDFNVPRGLNNEIYKKFTDRFKDNIPADITTTIDIPNHRIRHDPVEAAKLATYVVDYIFSTPEYVVSSVQCISGVSDHCAISATVSRGMRA